ncbi:hypothetical protein C0039_13120 [Pseudohalioglobus lutimaris]|uniref:Uncharacterized protein n=1 Tax=Pseudohalioglobus lutimaris TaxID=1737061 RepID=A0A2N5X1F8_9GAMM|nr:hypothetical protein C0039_13120 [Pseudohalioglobus lutimaris]
MVCGGLVSLVAMFFLSDSDIVTSQTLISLTLASFMLLALEVSTASIEASRARNGLSSKRLGIALICIGIWILAIISEESLDSILISSLLFGASVVVGDFSAVWRAVIVNSSAPRIRLIFINIAASLVRLVTFFFLFCLFNPLDAFIASAAISNFSRATLFYMYAKRIQKKSFLVKADGALYASDFGQPMFVQKVGAYFDRNPTIAIVLAITSSQPVFGLTATEYSLSILIMTFSANIAAYMWAKHENLGAENVVENLIQPVFLMFIFAVLFTMFFTFMPAGLVEADSLANLKERPFSLVVLPVVLGFSFGLNVFSYGSEYSWIRTLMLFSAFYFFGNNGFSICIVLNVAFFFFSLKTSVGTSDVNEAVE